MARKFLYIVAILILLVILGGVAVSIWYKELTQFALVPNEEFVQQAPLELNAYSDQSMWFAHPGMGAQSPANWKPALPEDEENPEDDNVGDAEGDADGDADNSDETDDAVEGSGTANSDAEEIANSDASTRADTDTPTGAAPPTEAEIAANDPPDFEAQLRRELPEEIEVERDFAVFFVHPTSFIDRNHWNGPLEDEYSQNIARVYVRGMASPFNQSDEIWAPRYRQATFGAFLSQKEAALEAIDFAYSDVKQAFDVFIETVDPKKPIILAGHSQGSLHILRLIREEVAGTNLEDRIAAYYPIGWPISVEHDLPFLGAEPCADAQEFGCLMTWSSYAEPADADIVLTFYKMSIGFDGEKRGDGAVLCTNPLLGMVGGEADAEANLGAAVPNDELSDGTLMQQFVPARCHDSGMLLIGEAPDMGNAVLPGNNYHVYDIPLFWRNLRADAARRVNSWSAAH